MCVGNTLYAVNAVTRSVGLCDISSNDCSLGSTHPIPPSRKIRCVGTRREGPLPPQPEVRGAWPSWAVPSPHIGSLSPATGRPAGTLLTDCALPDGDTVWQQEVVLAMSREPSSPAHTSPG